MVIITNREGTLNLDEMDLGPGCFRLPRKEATARPPEPLIEPYSKGESISVQPGHGGGRPEVPHPPTHLAGEAWNLTHIW